MIRTLNGVSICCVIAAVTLSTTAQAAKPGEVQLDWPPKLPGGKHVVTDSSQDFLKPTETLRPGVAIAKTAPKVDFLYYGGQDYDAKLWSAWGDSLAVGDKCYSSIGDHDGPSGNAFVYEYDSQTKQLREIVDLKKALKVPTDKYTPGKVHSRIDLGSDRWLYFSTHRGSTRVTLPKFGFSGGWILRHHPESGKTEIVAHAPLPGQTLPTSILDPERLIFYAGTQDGANEKSPMFLAYDVTKRRVLYSDDYGPYRYAILARSTGKLYYHGSRTVENRRAPGPLVCFDPENPGTPRQIEAVVGLRAATQELPDGMVYTIDRDNLWSFNTKTEKAQSLGAAAVASQDYTASLDADHGTGRYLYYVPGAHGGAHADGSPLVQYDVKTKARKVIAFLHPFYHKKYGFIPCGTYGVAVAPEGDKVYITWNGNRGTQEVGRKVRFNTCAFMVVHVPQSERLP